MRHFSEFIGPRIVHSPRQIASCISFSHSIVAANRLLMLLAIRNAATNVASEETRHKTTIISFERFTNMTCFEVGIRRFGLQFIVYAVHHIAQVLIGLQSSAESPVHQRVVCGTR